ncbi:MAG TPA: type II toxin-antitoxin system VapC family toxin [Candidatus Saccharimonadales bacterium]|nr:type II toxin-antitoxin system VapC family toxin [Candidatus Saccharimonadales bacterium]
MILLDANIFIYLTNGSIRAEALHDDVAFASVTKVEALGYNQITVAEQSYLEALFAECEQLDLDESIIQRAIRLRQQVRLTLGDAIIAATAIENDCELWTANAEDFICVEGLRLHNPLAK